MKQYFPKPNTGYLQTNRSDELGSIWSSFNLDFQKNLGSMKLSDKLVTNTTSSDDADLGLPYAFEFWANKWWAICGTRIFKSATAELTSAFTEDSSGYGIGTATTEFTVTNTSGTTYRYTYTGNGTDPLITALTVPVNSSVKISATNMASGNEGTFTVTASGNNYFEVTNASGVAEANKTISSVGYISVTSTATTLGKIYNINQSDFCIFDNLLYSSTPTVLYKKENEVGSRTHWYSLYNFGDTGISHKLAYFKRTNRLYFLDYISSACIVGSIDDQDVVATSGPYSLNINNTVNNPITMVTNSNYVWIGGIRRNDAENAPSLNNTFATITQWDGISAQATEEFVIKGASGIMAMFVEDNIPYAVDSEGRVLKYTGYSFKEIARLPIDRTLLTSSSVSSPTNGRFIHPNGFIATKNNTLLLSINNLNYNNSGNVTENLPSGIWELDLSTGNFTHKHAPTLKAYNSATVTDFGQNRILAAGAIKLNTLGSKAATGRSTLLAGFSYYTDATTTKSGIFIDSPDKPNTDNEGQKRGYFVTTWYESPEVESTWTKLWTIYKRFKNSTDKITFKYRLEEEDPIEATITWTSTSTFTTTTNISAYAGYEAEIIQGTGSGACTNITSVTELAGTYTATIDTAITGVTGTAKARFQKWKKIYPVASGTVKSYTEMPFDATNVRIQIKGILEWTGDGEFSKFILMDDEDIISNL